MIARRPVPRWLRSFMLVAVLMLLFRTGQHGVLGSILFFYLAYRGLRLVLCRDRRQA